MITVISNERREGGVAMVRPMFGKVETLGPWTAHIQAMDQALQSNDPGESVRSWRQAYSSALSHPGWLGLLTVANASLRLGDRKSTRLNSSHLVISYAV